MLYAVVQDVPTSWANYAALAAAIGDPVPDELILHVAGPTDDGFRTIEIWESREGWRRWCEQRLAPALSEALLAPPTLRELDAVAAIRGVASRGRKEER